MKSKLLTMVIVATIILLVVMSGCVNKQPITTTNTNFSETGTLTAIPTASIESLSNEKLSVYDNGDKEFIDAAEACYDGDYFSISNVTEHMEFVKCMQNTPSPKSDCAKRYKYYALKYTNEDSTTSGFKRETYNINLARQAFLDHTAWNATTFQFEPCSL
jgi:hypothetical protein